MIVPALIIRLIIFAPLILAKLPLQVTKRHLYGSSVLAGIGFTMSLFVSSLSFTDQTVLSTAKMSIMNTSVLAAAFGALIFRYIRP